MYIVYIIVKFQKSNYQSCIGNNQCLNDNNQFRICRYQLLTNWLLPMQDWLLPNVFLARRNNQFSMPYYQCMVLQCTFQDLFIDILHVKIRPFLRILKKCILLLKKVRFPSFFTLAVGKIWFKLIKCMCNSIFYHNLTFKIHRFQRYSL